MKIDYEKLKQLHITDDGTTKQICWSCHENRKNKKDKSLSINWERCIAHCHHCNQSFFFGKTEKLNDGQPPKQSLKKTDSKEYKTPGRLTNAEPLDENMRKWFEERGIPVEVAEAEGDRKSVV